MRNYISLYNRRSKTAIKIGFVTVFLCAEVKSNITKILNSEENSKRKVLNQITKSKAQSHQPNKKQLLHSWLGTGIFLCRKWWIEPGFIASLTSHLYYCRIKFHDIDNDAWTKQTDIINDHNLLINNQHSFNILSKSHHLYISIYI